MLPAIPDRTVPFYNLILYAPAPPRETVSLPPGFILSGYRPGDVANWAALETEIGDFPSLHAAQSYFEAAYGNHPSLLEERCLFVRTPSGEAAGSCIAWQDACDGRLVSSLHWLVVSPRFQGRGLGSALLAAALQRFPSAGPVYIHTQPWSVKALLLYVRHGFSLLRSGTFAQYENQYSQGMAVLKQLLSPEDYALLTRASVRLPSG